MLFQAFLVPPAPLLHLPPLMDSLQRAWSVHLLDCSVVVEESSYSDRKSNKDKAVDSKEEDSELYPSPSTLSVLEEDKLVEDRGTDKERCLVMNKQDKNE